MATTLCPKCSQTVGIPIADATTALVRCPLCDAKYLLRDALSPDALSPDEPLLVVLQSAAGQELTGPDGETLEFSNVDWPDASDAMPLEVKEQSEKLAAEGALEEAPLFDAPADEAPEGESPEEDEISWETPADESSENEAGAEADAPAEGFSTGASSTVATRRAKKKRRGPGPVTHFIGIVVFGLIGIVLGYFILGWVKKPARDEIDRSIAKVLPWWPFKPEQKNEESNTEKPESAVPKPESPAPKDEPRANQPTVTIPKFDVPPLGNGADAFGDPPAEARPDNPPEPPGAATGPPDAPPPAAEVPFQGAILGDSVTLETLEGAWETARKVVEKRASSLEGAEFRTLCELGHAAALVDDPASPKAANLLTSSAVLLRNASASARRNKVRYYAYYWLGASSAQRQGDGVWLLGKVEKIGALRTPKGNLTETRLAIVDAGNTRMVTVLSAMQPDYEPGDTAGILGTIVTKPAEKLTWYQGAEPLLVVSGVAVKLAEK